MTICFSTFASRALRWAAPEQARVPSGGQQ